MQRLAWGNKSSLWGLIAEHRRPTPRRGVVGGWSSPSYHFPQPKSVFEKPEPAAKAVEAVQIRASFR
jgi:hypothetical protein